MSSTTLNTDAVLEALGTVPAPGAEGESIVALGYVKDLKVEGATVTFRVEFPAPLTPARRAVARRCQEALAGLAEGANLTIELESKIPATFSSDGKAGLAPGVKNFVAIGSGKGGVGKSTLACNVAVGLAKAGARVGLLDTDVYGPSLPLLMGASRQAFMEQMELQGPPGPGQQPMLPTFEAHGVKCMSLGFLVDPEQAAIWRGPMVHGAVQQLLRDVEWGELDYLILDLPPGTGDVQLTLSQSVPLAGSVIVCTPQPVALADAKKALTMFEKTKTDCLGIVENMAYHVCRHCSERDDIFGSQGAQDAATEWNIPFLGGLPLDTTVRVSGDEGRPVLAREEEGPLGAALWSVIDRLTSVLASKAKSRPRSLPITRS